MILAAFQMDQTTDIALITNIIVFFIVGLIMLKIGLVASKAEVRTSFKWLLISFGIQVGLFFFVASPLILMGISGAFGEQGPEIVLIVIFIILAVFMDINLLNVLHRLGIKRALLVFALMAVPFLLVSFSIIGLIMIYA